MKKFLACVGISFLCANSAYASSPLQLSSKKNLPPNAHTNTVLPVNINQNQESLKTDYSFQKEPFTIAGTASLHSSPKQKPIRSMNPSKKRAVRNPRAMRSQSVVKGNMLNVDGTITSLTSTTDSMISYRQQRHLWETSDGGLHILINRGGTGQNSGLILYSSFDNGQTWTLSLALPNTGLPSNAVVIPSADGFLKNNKLLLSYITTTGGIKFLVSNYDVSTRQWTNVLASTIASNPQTFIGSNPTLLSDANGIFWCAFVSLNTVTKLYSIRLSRSNDQGQTWSDTGVVFGSESPSKARSARLLALRDRIGVVYTSDKNFYWAYRLNNSAPSANWQEQLIFQSTGDDQDPYGTHYSAITDAKFNIHLATISQKNLVYIRYKAQPQTWDIPIALTSSSGVAYPQVTSSPDNKLFVAFNAGKNGVSVLQSTDVGTTFSNAFYLTQPDTGAIGGVPDFSYPRMIMPSSILSSERLPILRQFSLDSIQRLSYYNTNAAQ